MNAMWIIFKREFKARVATKAFIIGTLLFPIIMGSLILIPALTGNSTKRTIAVVSEAPPELTDRFVELLGQDRTGKAKTDGVVFNVVRTPGTIAENEPALKERVLSKQLDGYVALPADVVAKNEIFYRARNISATAVNSDLQFAANRAIQGERLRAAGIGHDKLTEITKSVELNSGQITKDTFKRGSARSSFMLAYAIAFLVYITIIMQGVGLLRSVLEEKTNRISEIMVSSVRPGYLMAGKILGTGSASMLQVLIWITMVAIAVIVGSQGFFPPEIVNAFNIAPLDLIALLLFYILGFLLYSALFAAMGSMVNSEQEAQSIQSLGLLPLIIPMVFIVKVINDPLGNVATALSMIPFSAPITMPMRMASETLPAWEILTSLGLLAIGLAAVTWIAGRIYRIGILSTGKKPDMAELMRWIRSA